MPEIFTIRIRKEALKFASSHMTVFPNGTKESLHGHHYVPTVTVGINGSPEGRLRFKEMVEFSKIKSAMKTISDEWDEQVLLATENPYYKLIKLTKESIQFELCGKKYLLPRDEVTLLPLANITCEELSFLYSKLLKKKLPLLAKKPVSFWTVEIEESPGQSASYQDQHL